MTRIPENINNLWLSKRAGLEAWSSVWLRQDQHRHSHDFVQWTVTRSGSGSVVVRGQKHVCSPGVGVLIPAGEAHELPPHAAIPWQFDTLYLSPDELAAPGVARGEIASTARNLATADATVQKLFLALHGSVVRGEECLLQEELLHAFVARLSMLVDRPSVPEGPPGRSALLRVREYLDATSQRDVSLAELAVIAGVGEFHLSRSFRRAFGLPPHAYHLQRRINRARALLLDETPIAMVATRTGFADQAHFTRHFKRLVGVTPGRYLRQVKNVQDGRRRRR